MKTINSFFVSVLLSTGAMAQSNVGNWTFNSTISGAAATGAVVADASVGSSIPSLTTNNSTEYYGEGGWPAGALDVNAYVQFKVSANSSHYLVLNTVKMAIRRSSTGSPAGSGPNNWSLRSSLDNYATDLATGSNLDYNIANFTVTLPTAFQSIASTVTFRLYGYNMTLTSSGINRFVWDNFTVTGSVGNGILATEGIELHANAKGTGTVALDWTPTGFTSGASYSLQRSANGSDFTTIYKTAETGATSYAYDDAGAPASGRIYYRVSGSNPDGSETFSTIVSTVVADAGSMRIRGVVAQSGAVKALVHVAGGNYQLGIWSQDGKALVRQAWTGVRGDATADLTVGSMPHGVYVLTLTGEGTRVSRAFVL